MKPGFFAVCIVAVLFLSISAFAQPDLVGKGEYVGPTAVSVPDPDFPEAAKESGLGGLVLVNVRLDDVGNIISADESTGPDLVCPTVAREDVTAIREAARSAALSGKFLPATMDGKPVASVILLNFEFPRSDNKAVNAVIFSSTKQFPERKEPKEKVLAGGTTTVDKWSESARTAELTPKYTGSGITYSAIDLKAGSVELARARSGPKNDSGLIISGGVLNGKAVSLPKPPYPPAAMAVRVSGTVTTQVLIDTDGSVFSAVAVAGHPLLRHASRTAACLARFTPVHLSGTPVKVWGVITYNYNFLP